MRLAHRTLLVLLSLISFGNLVSAQELRHPEDASLRSVYFIDTKEGWACGDDGIVLHTLDGGRTWHRQPTGVTASLRSIQFLTPDIGWAVGRSELPHGMGSVGVVLFTNDGGLEWKRQLPDTLPGINQVRFVSTKVGFLVGEATDAFPAGVFRTVDSGRSWEPLAGPRTSGWLAADFYDVNTGIFAGAWSRLATLRGQRITMAEHSETLAGRDVNGVQILGKKTLAVAQGGLILTSVSGGSAWDFAKTDLPTNVLANCEFHAIHAVKDNVWVVGRPGSVVLHSPDGGVNWALHKTGQPLPLNGVFFFDEKHGWTVGDTGTILHTRDGGKTWALQHQGARRLAALCVKARGSSTPVDLIAHLGIADARHVGALRITAPDPATATWGGALDARRYASAVRRAGGLTGETLWHFPTPQHLEHADKKAVLAHWNRLHASHAEEELLRQLVLTLRVWRPGIVFGDDPESKRPLDALAGEALLEAVRRAADPKAYPEQITELGLEAWQAAGVFALSDAKSATQSVNVDTANTRLAGNARLFAGPAHALLTTRYTSLPRERHLHRLGNGTNATIASLMNEADGRSEKTQRHIHTDEAIDAKTPTPLSLAKQAVEMSESLDDANRTLALVTQMLDKLPDETVAMAAHAIASQYAERGQWFLAQEFYLYLVDRCPAHPLSADAYRWLLHLNTSGEARRRHDLKNFAVTEFINSGKKTATLPMKDKILRVGHEESMSIPLLTRLDIRDWNKASGEWAKRLAGYGAVHGYDPPIQFGLQAGKRRTGDATASAAWMQQYRKSVPSGPFAEAASAEIWLSNRTANSPRKLAWARQTEVRPFLDGKFDDPCWQNVKPMILDNAIGDSAKQQPTEVMFAFDPEHLYVALRCKHAKGNFVAPVKPRTTDADLDSFDRVQLLFDVDRDYGTFYQLEVDQRGCVRDSCWHDKNWNPRWFVAVHSTETEWQIEAAIPLGELTADPVGQATAWAFNAVRVLPGRGVQSWSQPADVEPRPEGMSVLLFATGTARPMTKEP